MNGFVHHIDLTVSNLELATQFYDRVMPLLGFRRSHNVPDGPIWAGAQLELGLVQADPVLARPHNRFTPGLHHLAFGAPEQAAVDRVYRQLLELNVAILDKPAYYEQYASGYYAVFFADPDGMKLEYVYTPKWPRP
jgi:glyoxylase I family protein